MLSRKQTTKGLICAFVVRIWQKQVFSQRASYKPRYNLLCYIVKKLDRSVTFGNTAELESFDPLHEKTCLKPYANNNGADQPAHLHSLICAFIVHCLDSITPVLAKSKISRF